VIVGFVQKAVLSVGVMSVHFVWMSSVFKWTDWLNLAAVLLASGVLVDRSGMKIEWLSEAFVLFWRVFCCQVGSGSRKPLV
jgi:hypothetical protein